LNKDNKLAGLVWSKVHANKGLEKGKQKTLFNVSNNYRNSLRAR